MCISCSKYRGYYTPKPDSAPLLEKPRERSAQRHLQVLRGQAALERPKCKDIGDKPEESGQERGNSPKQQAKDLSSRTHLLLICCVTLGKVLPSLGPSFPSCTRKALD